MDSASNGHRLVLFDIDGTLLSAGRASRERPYARLRLRGRRSRSRVDGYDFSGKTDPQIVAELLERPSGPRLESKKSGREFWRHTSKASMTASASRKWC